MFCPWKLLPVSTCNRLPSQSSSLRGKQIGPFSESDDLLSIAIWFYTAIFNTSKRAQIYNASFNLASYRTQGFDAELMNVSLVLRFFFQTCGSMFFVHVMIHFKQPPNAFPLHNGSPHMELLSVIIWVRS